LAAHQSEVEKLRGSCNYYQDLAESAQADAETLRSRIDSLERDLDNARADAAAAAEGPSGAARLQHGHTPRAAQQQGGGSPHFRSAALSSAASEAAAAVEVAAAAAVRAHELQVRCDALQEQLGRVKEELGALRATSEAMLQAKDADLLAALRKNAALAEELSTVRQALAAHRQQDGGANGAQRGQQQQGSWGAGGAADEAGMWAEASQVGFGRRSSNGSLGGNCAFSPKRGLRGGGAGGSMQLVGSSQLLGSVTPSEPGALCVVNGGCRWLWWVGWVMGGVQHH